MIQDESVVLMADKFLETVNVKICHIHKKIEIKLRKCNLVMQFLSLQLTNVLGMTI